MQTFSYEDVRYMTQGQVEEMGRQQRSSTEPGMGIPEPIRLILGVAIATAITVGVVVAAVYG